MLWHIMKLYSFYGFNEFIILLGYIGYMIKDFFANYFIQHSDVTFDILNNRTEILNNRAEPWKVTLIDTGINTMTGGRIKRVAKYLNNEPFMLTYGDGVSDVNISNLVDFHKSHGKLITMTSVQPEGRFGSLVLNGNNEVLRFQEKIKGDGNWINGGFFICQPEVLNYIDDDSTVFERNPLENLANEKQLITYKHTGFWKPMDTKKDKTELEEMIAGDNAPWMIWEKRRINQQIN
ncbi:MAG: glucose-1-phosphate cytidylyltransferase [Bacteroidota bacterium]